MDLVLTRGREGVKNPANLADVICERPLTTNWCSRLTRPHSENANYSRRDEQLLLRYPQERDPGDDRCKETKAGDHD